MNILNQYINQIILMLILALAAWLIQWGCFSLLGAEAANLLRERIMKNTLYSGGKRP